MNFIYLLSTPFIKMCIIDSIKKYFANFIFYRYLIMNSTIEETTISDCEWINPKKSSRRRQVVTRTGRYCINQPINKSFKYILQLFYNKPLF